MYQWYAVPTGAPEPSGARPARRGPAPVSLRKGLVLAAPLLLVLGVMAIAVFVAGLLPAWLVTRDDLNGPLRDHGRGPSGIRKGVRFALIVAEVSLTSLLLVGAGLMLRSFERVLSERALRLRLETPFDFSREGSVLVEIPEQGRVSRAHVRVVAWTGGGRLCALADVELAAPLDRIQRRASVRLPVRAAVRMLVLDNAVARDFREWNRRATEDGLSGESTDLVAGGVALRLMTRREFSRGERVFQDLFSVPGNIISAASGTLSYTVNGGGSVLIDTLVKYPLGSIDANDLTMFRTNSAGVNLNDVVLLSSGSVTTSQNVAAAAPASGLFSAVLVDNDGIQLGVGNVVGVEALHWDGDGSGRARR